LLTLVQADREVRRSEIEALGLARQAGEAIIAAKGTSGKPLTETQMAQWPRLNELLQQMPDLRDQIVK
jgi:hypothetical protein